MLEDSNSCTAVCAKIGLSKPLKGRAGYTTFLSARSAIERNGALFQTLQAVESEHPMRPPSKGNTSPLMVLPLRGLSLSSQETLSYALIESLYETHPTGHQLKEILPFLTEVPARVGHHAALDSAVTCIISAHRSLIQNHITESEVTAGYDKYVEALISLREAIEDPVQSTSSETLCATIVMGMYEVSFFWFAFSLPRLELP